MLPQTYRKHRKYWLWLMLSYHAIRLHTLGISALNSCIDYMYYGICLLYKTIRMYEMRSINEQEFRIIQRLGTLTIWRLGEVVEMAKGIGCLDQERRVEEAMMGAKLMRERGSRWNRG
jgi:hypothetical protein